MTLRLELVRPLGRGMMGEVFEARDERGERYVVKRLKPQVAGIFDLERFYRESKIMAALRHPNLMPVVFVDAQAKPPYYVMPFRRGETAAERRDQGRLGAVAVARLARDVCAGLVAAHERGIVHRDVKPGNIFIEETGRAILLDFGLAKDLESVEALTAAGMLVGTPAYMSPEQCRGERVSARADVYSLGVTLHELLTGKNPFLAEDVIGTLERQLRLVPKRLDVAMPQRVSPELGALVAAMLEKNPERRPPSLACLAKLRTICDQNERRAQEPTRLKARPWFELPAKTA
ncbi:MAG TPA: serine/threonine-protein kinase [Planctomycetota bacterium]|nr:serine/threonine-protein kinase [Planctomycetota bacterium]